MPPPNSETVLIQVDIQANNARLVELTKQLNARKPEMAKLDAYYGGDHPLAFASEKFRKAFGNLLDGMADNWCSVVVDAVEERLNVVGFRFGGVEPGVAVARGPPGATVVGVGVAGFAAVVPSARAIPCRVWWPLRRVR